ncbi:NAD(P)/FAD-dependent oxidoreductase [Aestuariicoccus sp. MJ-SS9]|uniref:NAD(P)/FAD-dependent oxidoreductase n=1 Tax=Aestuariicoccus sp. MJ-SS9 TaxID=3079855 RepID=UPI0029060C79|nr:NAD(P)/FAD-dependent oxidoreductase [Aestuariicoccus sp. MJ-SS9]MDU8913265.1 NAD(P)/FAD-dependent oxidoreductase [Aestuariicoccus sp. MJ-SS9]
MASQKIALIVGGGPAGLTAAYELATRSDIKPVVFEADDQVGGISKTITYKGNRIDIGGHRFFSKSDRVMDWWARMMPLERGGAGKGPLTISYQNQHRDVDVAGAGADPETEDEVMLVRSRVSRILFGRKFYSYPIKFSWQTFANLGLSQTVGIILSYAKARLSPIRPELTLRDYIINRFGVTLYDTFFKNYTEKVWGVPCEEIPADWGAQRIKGVSISALVAHVLKKVRPGRRDLSQKDMETSLIERFLYPKLGPGQLWEIVARKVEDNGGEVHMNTCVTGVHHEEGRITALDIRQPDGGTETIRGDLIFSSMPVQELVRGWQPAAPETVQSVSDGLTYRDFITVGVLLKRLTLAGGVDAASLADKVPDNWIYIQEPDVQVGRLQIFNNWSPYLVADPDTIWIGLEYFVNESDDFWSMHDDQIKAFAISELEALGVAAQGDVLDSVVARTKKAYPAYFGTYDRFHVIRDYVSTFDNLYCVGRNGMHRYNNQDHSILSAMVAVDGIIAGEDTRDAMWNINTEQEYHEKKS